MSKFTVWQKGSGMIYPDMATTLGFIFTDAKIKGSILKYLLKKNLQYI